MKKTNNDNNEKPLVTVIVPYVNAAATIERCLLSITDQSYDNLEIIFVGSNSTDDTYAILQSEQANDNRIKLITCEKKGPAAARNAAIKASLGEWIVFVDDDDALSEYAIEHMLEAAVKRGVDLVCGSYYLCNDVKFKRIARKLNDFKSFSKADTQRYFLSTGLNYNQAWGKLYKKNIFDSVRYTEEHFYEDIYALPHIIDAANGCVVTSEPVYFYFQNEDSISYDGNIARHFDGLKARIDNTEFYKKNYPKHYRLSQNAALEFSFYLLGRIYRKKESIDPAMWDDAVISLKKFKRKVKFPKFKTLCALAIFDIQPKFASMIFCKYSQIRNRQK